MISVSDRKEWIDEERSHYDGREGGRAQSGSKQTLNVGRTRNSITEMHSSNLAQELFYSFFGGGRNEWNRI